MNFKECLEKWENMERLVCDILNKNWISVILNPSKEWMDLILLENWIEVKVDEYSKKSWNFYIEVECNNKASWIFKDEALNLKYWCHSDWDVVYVIDWPTLKSFVTDKINLCKSNKTLRHREFRFVSEWWDWWRSKWLLIPVSIIREISLYQLYII
jgi:hypothetical protein